MSEKREYDAAVGGDVNLENQIQTYRYANAALKEFRTLLAASKQSTGTKLIFQTLPKHMRRRAMSHHPKRLPRKYRSIHISQMAKSGKQRISRRPSRKYRRRPSNLLQDYLRRQRRNVWLETHIWHAKRFHMIERWGYRLPLASCDKTYKACYRATNNHCLLQDISFYNCIELSGTVHHLFDGIKKISNNGLTIYQGLTIKALTFLNGQREGTIDLFRNGRFPEGALCRATFMWRPINGENQMNDNIERMLWLWIHPCAYSIVLEELINIFQVQLIKKQKSEAEAEADNTETSDPQENDETKMDPTTKILTTKQQTRFKFITKNLAHARAKRYTNCQTGINLVDLKDNLNRFRMTGPLSQSILLHAFKPKDMRICGEEKKNEMVSDWFQELISLDEEFQKQHTAQTSYWEKCEYLSTPAALRPNMIFALNIVDPRLQRPTKRTKARPNMALINEKTPNFLDLLVNVPKNLSQSSLWDENVRQNLRSKMLDTKSWCQLRQKHALVPGANCAFENTLQPIPVLLIQRPGLQDNHKQLNYGCGWDVIAPAGYGMSIWLTLIMWGAKPGGLRELQTLACEMGNEMHLPDTIAGRQQAMDRYQVSYDKYFRLPPGKRQNYRKLAIASPFRAPWIQLLRDWMLENNNSSVVIPPPPPPPSVFFVERDKLKLSHLNKMLHSIKSVTQTTTKLPFEINSNGLIQVQLRMRARGNIGKNALICLPKPSDILKHYKNVMRHTSGSVYAEPLQPDLNEKERKVVRLEHKKQLKRLRAKRIREKRKLQETSTKRVRIRPANTASIVSAHFARMCKLWLPDQDCATFLSVRKQCSRETFGYVTEANFSLKCATVCAIGYITMQGLEKLFHIIRSARRGQPMCLLRDVNSQHYYFATFEISQNP